MIWSLVKIMLFILAVAIASYLATLVLTLDGNLQLQVFNYEISTSPVVVIFGLVTLVPVIWLAFYIFGLLSAFIRFAVGDSTAMTRYLDKSRERRGYEALAESMVALASGDPRTASEKIVTAELHLNRPELTGLLAAQAEERLGNQDNAEKIYRRLLGDEKTRFSGLVGILKHRLDQGDADTVLELARRAAELRPKHEEVQKILQSIQCRIGDWSGARTTLKNRFRNHLITRREFERGDAVMALAEARALADESRNPEAIKTLARTLKLEPGLVPGAVLASRLRLEAGESRTAVRVLTRAWNLNPHPELVDAYAAIAPEETSEQRIDRFRKFTSRTATHPETRMLMAELAIANSDHKTAGEWLGDLPDTEPTARSLVIKAAIERARGSRESVVQNLLSRAVSASRGPQWQCSGCYQVFVRWDPLCSNCMMFDTFQWKTVFESEGGHQLLADMLPRVLPSLVESGSQDAYLPDIADDLDQVIDKISIMDPK